MFEAVLINSEVLADRSSSVGIILWNQCTQLVLQIYKENVANSRCSSCDQLFHA